MIVSETEKSIQQNMKLFWKTGNLLFYILHIPGQQQDTVYSAVQCSQRHKELNQTTDHLTERT